MKWGIQKVVPCFKQLSLTDLSAGLLSQYANPTFYTPKYQKISFTNDFLQYLYFLRRKRYVTSQDLHQFVENTLIQFEMVMREDRPDLHVNLEKNANIPVSAVCKYHGTVDWLYSNNGMNPTPIIFCNQVLNPGAGIAAAYSNMYLRKSINQQIAKASSPSNGFSIITTGQQWQLMMVDQDLKLQKSVVLQGEKRFRNIYEDENMVEVVLGMLEFCMQTPRESVNVLESAYDYLDDRKYMELAPSEAEAKQSSLFSKILTHFSKRRK